MKRLLFLPVMLVAGCAAQTTTSPTASNTPRPVMASEPDSPATASDSPDAVGRLVGVQDGQTNALGLTLPAGFRVNVFAQGLDRPRRIAVVPNVKNKTGYDVAVSQSYASNVVLLRDANGDGISDSQTTLASQINKPYGIEFGGNYIFIAATDAVWRYPFVPGQTQLGGAGQKIATLTQGGYNNHWTRNLLFDSSKRNLYVTVGSSCNTCEESDPQRAAISVMGPDGSNKRLLASGLRNPTGITWNPATKTLWTVVNERDNLGDDVPPDYLTQVGKNRFYGWPYAYTTIDKKVMADPTFGSRSPQKVAATIAPDVPVQAHSAALGVAFYPLTATKFPAEFRGDAFLAFHGSWNRSQKTGYKIVRVNFENGKATAISDFVTGFLKTDGSNWGRPVDIQSAPDGSLLFSDDQGGKIWRVSYVGSGATKSADPSAKNS
ncbi:sorbosone dehydrogenase family protein [bacterium]|nr:MAG: sorbosone dehydrogenase family protein [bacterium]